MFTGMPAILDPPVAKVGLTEARQSALKASEVSTLMLTYLGQALRLPHMKKRDKSLAILYSLGDAIDIVHQTNTGRARK